MHGIYAHARVDDLDHDTLMQSHSGLAKAKQISVELSRQTSQAISMKRARIVGHFTVIYLFIEGL